MTTPPPPPRKRFQIHLSTAIVMMFVAGALMWAIIIPEGQEVWQYDVLQDPDAPDINLFPRGFTTVLFGFFSLFALVILLVVYFVCEWLIRRRAARKGS